MEGSENIFSLLGNHSKTLFVSLGFCTYNTEFGTLFWWHFYKLRRQEGKNNITLLKYIGSRPLKQKRRENRIMFKSSTSNLIMALYAFYFWSCICIYSHNGWCVLFHTFAICLLTIINVIDEFLSNLSFSIDWKHCNDISDHCFRIKSSISMRTQPYSFCKILKRNTHLIFFFVWSKLNLEENQMCGKREIILDCTNTFNVLEKEILLTKIGFLIAQLMSTKLPIVFIFMAA